MNSGSKAKVQRFLALTVLFFSAIVPAAHGATGTVAPMPKALCLDNNGAIVNGGLIFTYTAGTTTKLTTYSDAALTTPNANPVVCDSAGRATIFLSASAYKFTYAPSTDTDPPTNAYFTVDNIAAVPYLTTDLDITGTAGEALSAGNAVYLSDGSGALTAGRWYKTDSDNTYSSITAQAIGFAVADIASAASGSIRIQGKVTGLAGLAAGSVYYVSATAGAITSTAPTNQRAVGVADSGTTLVLSGSLTLPDATQTLAGKVSLSAQTLGSGLKTFAEAPKFYIDNTGAGDTAYASGTPYYSVTSTANVGVAEQDLIVHTVNANTLNRDGRALRLTAWGEFAADADAKEVLIKLGSATLSMISFSANANIVNWRCEATIVRVSSGNQLVSAGCTASRAAPGEGQGFPVARHTTATQTDTATISVGIRANGDNNDDIVQKGSILEVLR